MGQMGGKRQPLQQRYDILNSILDIHVFLDMHVFRLMPQIGCRQRRGDSFQGLPGRKTLHRVSV